MEVDFARSEERAKLELFARLALAGDDTLTDAELLEAILCNESDRPDGQALAHRLLATFGTLAKIVHGAEECVLRGVTGMDEARLSRLRLLRIAMRRTLKAEIRSAPLIGSRSVLMDYLRLAMGHQRVEQFRVLFLDHSHRLLLDEVMQRGTVNHTPIYPREVVRRALELDAAAMILVHNHPTGDMTPSQKDIDITAQVIQAAAAVDVMVHDHVIVGDAGCFSFAGQGLLPAPPGTSPVSSTNPQTETPGRA
jgi:DNA repair protein RadC